MTQLDPAGISAAETQQNLHVLSRVAAFYMWPLMMEKLLCKKKRQTTRSLWTWKVSLYVYTSKTSGYIWIFSGQKSKISRYPRWFNAWHFFNPILGGHWGHLLSMFFFNPLTPNPLPPIPPKNTTKVPSSTDHQFSTCFFFLSLLVSHKKP